MFKSDTNKVIHIKLKILQTLIMLKLNSSIKRNIFALHKI